MGAVVLTVKASYVASTKYRKTLEQQQLAPVVVWRTRAPDMLPLVTREREEEVRAKVGPVLLPPSSYRSYILNPPSPSTPLSPLYPLLFPPHLEPSSPLLTPPHPLPKVRKGTGPRLPSPQRILADYDGGRSHS